MDYAIFPTIPAKVRESISQRKEPELKKLKYRRIFYNKWKFV